MSHQLPNQLLNQVDQNQEGLRCHRATGTRLAIAQLQMHWSLEDNMSLIRRALSLAHDQGAVICAFSELAITGFHRRIAEWAKPEWVQPALAELQQWAAWLELGIVVGAPSFGEAGERYITQHLVDESGHLAASVSKQGLTEPEATFFHPGWHRPVGLLQGQRCSAVICREIEDLDQVTAQLARSAVDIVFVPGALRQDPAKPRTDPPPYFENIRALALALNAYIVQVNWPNALNRPDESVDLGASCVVAPDGELLLRVPPQASGVGVVELGERHVGWQAF